MMWFRLTFFRRKREMVLCHFLPTARERHLLGKVKVVSNKCFRGVGAAPNKAWSACATRTGPRRCRAGRSTLSLDAEAGPVQRPVVALS